MVCKYLCCTWCYTRASSRINLRQAHQNKPQNELWPAGQSKEARGVPTLQYILLSTWSDCRLVGPWPAAPVKRETDVPILKGRDIFPLNTWSSTLFNVGPTKQCRSSAQEGSTFGATEYTLQLEGQHLATLNHLRPSSGRQGVMQLTYAAAPLSTVKLTRARRQNTLNRSSVASRATRLRPSLQTATAKLPRRASSLNTE